MESPEGPQTEIRHTIREHLDDLEHRLTGELTEKLTERKHLYLWWGRGRCKLITCDVQRSQNVLGRKDRLSPRD